MYFVGTDFWLLLIAALCMVVAFWFAEKHERKQRRSEKRRERGRIGSGGEPGSLDARRTASEYAGSGDNPAQATAAKGLSRTPGASYLAALRRIHGRKP